MSAAVQAVVSRIQGLAPARRVLVAIAGAPGTGKSTLAQLLAGAVEGCVVVPMDGFHLPTAVLAGHGWVGERGTPRTFDAGAFVALLRTLHTGRPARAPSFDRSREEPVPAAIAVPAQAPLVIVEGNYLLLDDPDWAPLRQHFHLTVMLREDRETIEQRLLARWRHHGFDAATAEAKVQRNDLPNADLVLARSAAADIELDGPGG